MKRVLILSYAYPPCAESGTQRVTKFVKYFSEFGWQPGVLTVHEKYYDLKDSTRYKGIPLTVKVYRTRMFTNPLRWLVKLSFIFRNGDKEDKNPHLDQAVSKTSHTKPAATDDSKLKQIVISLFSTPDAQIFWAPNAFLKGLRIIRNQKIDAVVTSGPPMSTHLIGYLLKKWARTAWIADFRDPWHPEGKEGLTFFDKMETWLRDRVVSSADRIICNTEWAREDFYKRYPTCSREKFKIIPNGFDATDFAKNGNDTQKPDQVFTITHTGDFYVGRSSLPLLKAISGLIQDHKIPEKEIAVIFVGREGHEDGMPIRSVLEQLNIKNIVHMVGHVPHDDAIDFMLTSHVLFLTQPLATFSVPAKFYEYLRAGKFILALAPQSATREIIERTGSGYVLEPNDLEGLKKAVYELYRRFKENRLQPHVEEKVIQQFEYRELTKSLACLLEEVCHCKPEEKRS